ncbi:NYN domain-containing protein [Chloroflexota bacterium]
MSTNVYIDGLNLYYGALYNTPFKWLDIGALCSTLLPGRSINRIRYFTARVISLPHDQNAPTRQDIYLRALRTIPNLTIHDESRFAARVSLYPQYPLAYINNQLNKPPNRVQVQKLEEKRSDVNLASWLLDDFFSKDFDDAVVISNDSDLTTPIEIITTKYSKNVGVINPHHKRKPSRDLRNAATFSMQTINRKVLANCQFPPTLTDISGIFTKPPSW